MVDIACGWSHSIGIKNDGTVWAWGYNDFGQLGLGDTTNRFSPVQIPGISGGKSAACGAWHSLILKNDSTVWACGINGYGTLGNNTTTQSSNPVQTLITPNVTFISSGGADCYAIKSDGSLWAWGRNSFWQLGDTTFLWQENQPKQLTGFTGIKNVATGGWAFAFALKNDGTLWSWGLNTKGELGLGYYYYMNNQKIPTELTDPCSPTADINESENNFEITIYPNPATNFINIDVSNPVSVSIIDLTGKLILQSNQKLIDVSQLAKGIYSIVIISGENRVVKKLVKM
jgi:alpha-tubulin suppressor-like RCC1 family protein